MVKKSVKVIVNNNNNNNKIVNDEIFNLLTKIYNNKKKSGVILTANQLLQYALKKNKNVTKKQVASFLQGQINYSRFVNTASRPKRFQSISYPRIGLYFLDYAEYQKKDAWHNKGYTGFLVAVENVTNRLFVIPCKGKSTSQWEKAVDEFIDNVKNVRVIYTDRDAVATSPTFQQKIKALYNIKWYFMVKGSKSYLAERYIRYTKEKLSQACEIKETKNWLQFIKAICDEHNKETIEKTSYTRNAIDKKNFNHFLEQRLTTTTTRNKKKKNIITSNDPTLLFNSARIYGGFQSDKWNKSIFKFSVGSKVLLANRADWNKKQHAFQKTSQWGTFGTTIYTIIGRQLRSTKNFRGYAPMYSLSTFGPDRLFYTNELKHAGS